MFDAPCTFKLHYRPWTFRFWWHRISSKGTDHGIKLGPLSLDWWTWDGTWGIGLHFWNRRVYEYSTWDISMLRRKRTRVEGSAGRTPKR